MSLGKFREEKEKLRDELFNLFASRHEMSLRIEFIQKELQLVDEKLEAVEATAKLEQQLKEAEAKIAELTQEKAETKLKDTFVETKLEDENESSIKEVTAKKAPPATTGKPTAATKAASGDAPITSDDAPVTPFAPIDETILVKNKKK